MTGCLALGLMLVTGVQTAQAQSAEELEALRSEIEALKREKEAVQEQLEESQQLLKQQPQPQTKKKRPAFEPRDLAIAGAPYLGRRDAPVTLVEYTDYQCPYCRRHFERTQPELVKDYVETGELKYVVREFPIEVLHKRAFKASESALCAGDQGRYWDMHDVLMQNQRKLGPEDLSAHAAGLGLDMSRFQECLDGGAHAETVRRDQKEGAEAGITGTPSFLVGLTDREDPDSFRATRLLPGAYPYAVYRRVIESLLARSRKGS